MDQVGGGVGKRAENIQHEVVSQMRCVGSRAVYRNLGPSLPTHKVKGSSFLWID